MIENQITIDDYLEEIRLYEEFSKYMNKPEKEEGNGQSKPSGAL